MLEPMKAPIFYTRHGYAYGEHNMHEAYCHAPHLKIRGNGVATKVGDVCTREKYPTHIR